MRLATHERLRTALANVWKLREALDKETPPELATLKAQLEVIAAQIDFSIRMDAIP